MVKKTVFGHFGSFKIFFFEKRALSVVFIYQYLTSDQKLAKSLDWKYHNFSGHTIYWAVGSTEVENCIVLSDLLHFSVLLTCPKTFIMNMKKMSTSGIVLQYSMDIFAGEVLKGWNAAFILFVNILLFL